MANRQPTAQEQVKGLRVASRAVVVAGLLVGVGMPVLFSMTGVAGPKTSSGFDLYWLLFWFIMLVDFGLAIWLARRATAIERSIRPLDFEKGA